MTANAASQKEGSRVVSGFLIAIGCVALGVSMWMNARFGWGLSGDFTDRTTLAILHVIVDPAAAGLVFAGTMMRRWGWKKEGRWFQIIALLLILYSMLSVYGFMSARIAVTQSNDAVVAMQKGQLDWLNKTMVNKELPKMERRLLRSDAKELAKDIRSSLSIIPDAQAASIANMLGWEVMTVQRILIMISSGIAQTLKFVCILAGVMIWPRHQASPKASQASPQASGGGGGGIEVPKLSVINGKSEKASLVASQASPRASPQASQASMPGDASITAEHRRVIDRALAASKWSTAEFDDFLKNGAAGLSTRQIAEQTGYSQPWVSRKQRRLLASEASRIRREASRASQQASPRGQDIGGSYHNAPPRIQ
jgi:hypothetical protein